MQNILISFYGNIKKLILKKLIGFKILIKSLYLPN